MFRLGEDLVGSGRRTPCDKTRQAAVLQVGFNRSELVLGGKSSDNFEVEVEGTFGVAWGIRATNGRAKELESSIGICYPLTMASACEQGCDGVLFMLTRWIFEACNLG